MKQFILSLVCCFVFLGACQISDPNNPDPNNPDTKQPQTKKDECAHELDCLKKVCPQKLEELFQQCIQNFHTFDQPGPKYQMCSIKEKDYKTCQESTSQVQDGKIWVELPDNLTKLSQESLQALRTYIFPNQDLYGEPITCKILLEETKKDPAILMDFKWGRFFPSRNSESPFDTPVDRFGTRLPLLFQKVPAGKNRILLIQGFCISSKPRTKETPATFIACKEKVEIKAEAEISITLPMKEGACFP